MKYLCKITTKGMYLYKLAIHLFQEYFEDLVKFMTSGPSHVLVLTKGETGDHVIEDWRELLGPASVEEAQEQAPERSNVKR